MVLPLDYESSLWLDFLKKLDESRALSAFIMDVLELYHNDEYVREVIKERMIEKAMNERHMTSVEMRLEKINSLHMSNTNITSMLKGVIGQAYSGVKEPPKELPSAEPVASLPEPDTGVNQRLDNLEKLLPELTTQMQLLASALTQTQIPATVPVEAPATPSVVALVAPSAPVAPVVAPVASEPVSAAPQPLVQSEPVPVPNPVVAPVTNPVIDPVVTPAPVEEITEKVSNVAQDTASAPVTEEAPKRVNPYAIVEEAEPEYKAPVSGGLNFVDDEPKPANKGIGGITFTDDPVETDEKGKKDGGEDGDDQPPVPASFNKLFNSMKRG